MFLPTSGNAKLKDIDNDEGYYEAKRRIVTGYEYSVEVRDRCLFKRGI